MTASQTTHHSKDPKADVGSVFISNYPPYSAWEPDHAQTVMQALEQPAKEDTPLGLYLHIPFCRKRCKFCYFKVYTDKNSKEIQAYLDAVTQEIALVAKKPALLGRKARFLYIGGGTPSYISARHLRQLIGTLRQHFDLSELEEFTFECEPGTLTEAKVAAIHDVGVTRLSLGVENFNDEVLAENGRAHLSAEIHRVRPWISDLHFGQLNIDLIAGMIGETWQNWQTNIQKAIEFEPDSITIYQMELPFNTIYSNGILHEDGSVPPFADWETKRAWHDYAIQTLSQAGFVISSAYTMVRGDREIHFRYRDSLWRGADLLPLGVSSFGHLAGIHYQNDPSINRYVADLEQGRLPIRRAFATTANQRLIRELILQLKMGQVGKAYFQEKFDVDITDRFSAVLAAYQKEGLLVVEKQQVRLTRAGLLQVDRLLPAFYEPEFIHARYT